MIKSKILIVDDEVGIRELLSEILQAKYDSMTVETDFAYMVNLNKTSNLLSILDSALVNTIFGKNIFARFDYRCT